MDKLKLYTHEEMLDVIVGVKGTPRRDKYEADIDNFLIGEAIKKAREDKNPIVRAFRAMGIKSANLELGSLGKVAL